MSDSPGGLVLPEPTDEARARLPDDDLDEVVASFDATTRLPALVPTFTRFGAGIQAVAAGTVALGPVYDDPIAAAPRRAASPDRCQGPAPCAEHAFA